MAECLYFERRPAVGEYSPHAALGPELTFQPTAPLQGPASWRRVAVEVSPERVKAEWQGRGGAWETVCEIGEGNLTGLMIRELARADPNLTGGDFRPRSGLGLYVYRGKASFRRVVVEPLGGEGQ
jgi:hypothetical protein